MKREFALFTTVVLMANPVMAFAMPGCGSASDRAALKTAALQQELMVAALRCHDTNEYNRFVLSHRSELISSDDALKAYFQSGDKQRGTATYNKYKTELANTASLESSRDLDAFCGVAEQEFDVALEPASLSTIVAQIDLVADGSGENCPVLAENRPTTALEVAGRDRQPSGADWRPARSPESNEGWTDDDDSRDFDNSDEYGDEPSDLMAPAPHSMLDEDADH